MGFKMSRFRCCVVFVLLLAVAAVVRAGEVETRGGKKLQGAVAIDGTIYRDTWSKELPKGAEVFLLPRLAGG